MVKRIQSWLVSHSPLKTTCSEMALVRDRSAIGGDGAIMKDAKKTRENLLAEAAELRERIELLESDRMPEERRADALEDDLRLARMLAEASSDSLDTREVARLLASEIQRLFDTHSVNLYVLTPDGARLEMQNVGIAPGLISAAERILGHRIPLVEIPKTDSSSYWRTIERNEIAVYRTREEVETVIREFAAATPLAPAALPTDLSIPIKAVLKILALKSSVHIPLSARGRQLGLLSVSSRHQLTDPEISRLTSISVHVAGILAAVQAEQDWRRERNRADSYLGSAPGFMLVLDVAGRVQAISADGCEILGLPERDIIGRDWAESFVPERFRQSAVTRISATLGGDSDKIFDGHALTARGDERVVRWRTSAIRDSGGKVTALLATGVDLTRVMQSEERELRDRKRFRALLENSTDLTFILDAQGVFTYVSPSGADSLSYAPEELIGTSAATLIHPEDAELYAGAMRLATSTPGPSPNYSMRLLAKDGSLRVFEGIANMQLDNPDIDGVVLNLRDVTERERMEGTIENSAARFRALIENSHELMLVLSPDLKVRYASPSCSRDLGYTMEALQGVNFEELVHGTDLDRKLFRVSGVDGVAPYSIRMRLRTEDRQWVPYDITITEMLESSAIEGFVINATQCVGEMEAPESA